VAGGVRVPSFVSGPGLSSVAGQQYNNLFHVSDWMPTILGFAGLQTPDGMSLDGIDHSAAFLGPSNERSCPRAA
jgi:arylsulfatase A-like enzyme